MSTSPTQKFLFGRQLSSSYIFGKQNFFKAMHLLQQNSYFSLSYRPTRNHLKNLLKEQSLAMISKITLVSIKRINCA